MSKSSNQHIVMMLIAVSIVIVLGLTAYVGKSVWDKAEAQRAEKRLQETMKQQDLAAQKQQAKAIEVILTRLLDDVSTQAGAYRKERQILTELIQEKNLKSADYINENLTLMEGTILSLRNKMDQIMAAFQRADNEFKAVAAMQSVERQNELNAEWKAMTSEHFQTYVTFFDIEEKQMAAHLTLMKFLKQNAAAMQYDEVNGAMLFTSESLMDQDEKLRTAIKALYLEQARSMAATPENRP